MKLRELRKRYNLSQTDVAALIGRSHTWVDFLERRDESGVLTTRQEVRLRRAVVRLALLQQDYEKKFSAIKDEIELLDIKLFGKKVTPIQWASEKEKP